MDILILASEVGEKGFWYPFLQGILVVVCAIALFCGSAYLLLATNLGARLGFLVAFSGLTGFLVILSLLWVTTGSPLNTLRGSLPEWKVLDVVSNLDAESVPATARDGVDDANVADETQAADVKAAVDARLVTVPAEGGVEPAPEVNEYARFAEVTEFQTTNTWVIGGSDPNPLELQVTHTPRYAVVEFCKVREVDQTFGLAPPEPECDPNASEDMAGFVVLERDLGSVRLPAFVALLAFSLLFVLSLLLLHWRERDEQELAAGGDGEPKVPAKV